MNLRKVLQTSHKRKASVALALRYKQLVRLKPHSEPGDEVDIGLIKGQASF